MGWNYMQFNIHLHALAFDAQTSLSIKKSSIDWFAHTRICGNNVFFHLSNGEYVCSRS